jgi:hypothetical protein
MIIYLVTKNSIAEECDHIEAWADKAKAEVRVKELDALMAVEDPGWARMFPYAHHVSEVELIS